MNKAPKPNILYYVHDPMCSWCWAFRTTWKQIQAALANQIEIKYVLGGLAPDNQDLMPPALQANIRQIWQTIQQQVPGTEFNYDFWTQCQPRRSTYPACRAVIAARNQGNTFEKAMLLAIQQAYYLDARNPSDDKVLIDLAQTLGLEPERFQTDLNSSNTQQQLKKEIIFSQRIGAMGFPSLIMENQDGLRSINFDYNDAQLTISNINLKNNLILLKFK